MINFIRFMCVVLCFFASGNVFGNKVSGRLGKELEKALKGRSVTLRGSIHQNPMTYYEHGGNVYYYAHSRRYPVLFRIEKDEPVQIRSVKVRDDAVEVELRSVRLGKGLVSFSAPLHSPPVNRAAFDVGFALCFRTGEETEALPALIGNTGSKVFHVASCNHLPDADKRQVFYTHAEAEGSGMRACKLCFMRMPLVSDYATERTLALYASQQIQSMGQLSTDDALQLRARKIGKRVLDNWPVPLQGYKYRFSVMDDDEVNAYQSVDKVALHARPSHCGRRQGARPRRIGGFGEGVQRSSSATRAGRSPDGLFQRAAMPYPRDSCLSIEVCLRRPKVSWKSRG